LKREQPHLPYSCSVQGFHCCSNAASGRGFDVRRGHACRLGRRKRFKWSKIQGQNSHDLRQYLQGWSWIMGEQTIEPRALGMRTQAGHEENELAAGTDMVSRCGRACRMEEDWTIEHEAISQACATLANDPCRKPIHGQRRFGLIAEADHLAAGPFES
jgi:hypothetical protein